MGDKAGTPKTLRGAKVKDKKAPSRVLSFSVILVDCFQFKNNPMHTEHDLLSHCKIKTQGQPTSALAVELYSLYPTEQPTLNKGGLGRLRRRRALFTVYLSD